MIYSPLNEKDNGMRQGCTIRKGQIMQGLEDHVKNFEHFPKVNVEFLVSVMKKFTYKKYSCVKEKIIKNICLYILYIRVYA